MHPLVVHAHAVCGLDDKGADRLRRAAQFETVPISEYRFLMSGRLCDNLRDTDFAELINEILKRDGGEDVALDIVRMRLFSRQSEKRALTAAEKEVGKTLLKLAKFERSSRSNGKELANIAKECLTPDVDNLLAEKICHDLLDAIEQWKVSLSDYGEMIAELGGKFPRIALDVFVDRDFERLEDRRGVLFNRRDSNVCPLSKIDSVVMLDWAKENQGIRLNKLARCIRPWERADGVNVDYEDESSYGESVPIRWTLAAIKILRESDDPKLMLSFYVETFRPSGWSGSLADIMERKIPLLEALQQDTNPVISTTANEMILSYREDIIRTREWEKDMWKREDERFEW